MKTNELSNELKKVYAKPEIEVEEMELQWAVATCSNPDEEHFDEDTGEECTSDVGAAGGSEVYNSKG